MTNSEKDEAIMRFNYLCAKREALKVRNEILRKEIDINKRVMIACKKDIELNKRVMIACKKEMSAIKRSFKNE